MKNYSASVHGNTLPQAEEPKIRTAVDPDWQELVKTSRVETLPAELTDLLRQFIIKDSANWSRALDPGELSGPELVMEAVRHPQDKNRINVAVFPRGRSEGISRINSFYKDIWPENSAMYALLDAFMTGEKRDENVSGTKGKINQLLDDDLPKAA